jgi:small subunit ribosomal protein S6
MRNYEVMTIHRPEIAEVDVRLKVAEIEALLKARGAEVTDSDFWGKRRFAYEINHIREGFYSVVQFDLEGSPEALEDLDRALALSDAVVRHKVVRRDNR